MSNEELIERAESYINTYLNGYARGLAHELQNGYGRAVVQDLITALRASEAGKWQDIKSYPCLFR